MEPTNDLDVLQQWIGRSESTTDTISRAVCQRLEHTLGSDRELQDGEPMPLLRHFVTHVGSVPASEVGRDGHPKRGGFLPPVALPRRMWAGSRITFHDDVVIGDAVTKTSTIDDVQLKVGRSGTLCFVTVRHEHHVGGELRIEEQQDLVYREDPAPDAPKPEPKPAPTDGVWSATVEPSEVMLFRYSALMFNGHRIHYDRDYARDVEGYDGLVVQGPLTATLLAELAMAETGRQLATWSFRGMAPLTDVATFSIHGTPTDDGARLWATTNAGGLAMQAEATFR